MNQREPVIIEKDEFDISYVIGQFRSKWYWFLLTVPLCLAVATWYVRSAVMTYTVSSKVLIHVDDDQKFYGEDAISGLNFMFRAKTVNNEIAMLTSRDLVSRALNSLDLNLTYYWEGRIQDEVYSEQLPFKLFADVSKANDVLGKGFELEFLENDLIHITASDGEEMTFAFGETIHLSGMTFYMHRRPSDYFEELPERRLTFYINSDEAILNSFMGKLSVMESDKDTDAITLAMDETLPERGQDFLNSLIKYYVIQVMEDRKRIAQNTYDFIDERLRLNFAHLDSLEFAIDKYKRRHNLTEPSIEARYILEGIKKFEIELNDALTQREIVDDLVQKAVSDPRLELDLSIPNTILGVTDPLLNDMMIDLNRKQYELRTLSKTVEPENPLYLELMAQVEDLRSSVMVDLLNLQDNMATTVSYIEDQIEEYKRRLAELNYDETDLTSMERIRNTKEELYIYLLKKREEAAMILASELMDTWLIEKPYVSSFFYNPRKSIVYIIALFLGVFIPTAFILLWLLFDNKLRTPKDIKQIVDVPLVGQVATDKLAIKDKGERLHTSTKVKEEFKRLAFNLRFFKEDFKTIMVSSMSSNDGKSFSSIHLGLTHAALGKKTCILELDLRRPSIAAMMGLEKNSRGLVDHLVGDVGLEEAMTPCPDHGQLMVIPAGMQAIDPTRLLVGDRLTKLIDKLKEEFDVVILDTPPIGVVSDALLLSRFAEINLIVARQDNTRKEKLKYLKEVIENKRIGDVAILYNGAKADMSDLQYVYGEARQERFSLREILFRKLARS